MDRHVAVQDSHPRPKRILSLKVLVLGMLMFSLFGWLRLQQSVSSWVFLIQLGIHPGPLYLALSGTLWGMLGLTSAVSLWYCLPWSFIFSEGTAVMFVASYWLDRLALSHPAAGQSNLLFAIGLTIIGLIYTFGVSETLKRAFQ